jgi:DNA polymerase III gamma/tau subunit
MVHLYNYLINRQKKGINMSKTEEILSNKPENIGKTALSLALANKKKTEDNKFSQFYDDNIMGILYYIWKTYDLHIADILIYIEAEYKRKTSATYIKTKLLAFEKKLKKADTKKAESTKSGQYCFSSEKPIKHPTFVKSTPDSASTEKSHISAFDEKEKTVVSKETQEPMQKTKSEKKVPESKPRKKAETVATPERKPAVKKAEKKPVNNSLPKKKTTSSVTSKKVKDNDNQNKKYKSIRDKYPEHFKNKETKKDTSFIKENVPTHP